MSECGDYEYNNNARIVMCGKHGAAKSHCELADRDHRLAEIARIIESATMISHGGDRIPCIRTSGEVEEMYRRIYQLAKRAKA